MYTGIQLQDWLYNLIYDKEVERTTGRVGVDGWVGSGNNKKQSSSGR